MSPQSLPHLEETLDDSEPVSETEAEELARVAFTLSL